MCLCTFQKYLAVFTLTKFSKFAAHEAGWKIPYTVLIRKRLKKSFFFKINITEISGIFMGSLVSPVFTEVFIDIFNRVTFESFNYYPKFRPSVCSYFNYFGHM